MTRPGDPDGELDRLLGDNDGGADAGNDFGAIYRRLPRAEPPRRLDRNVLAEAARAVHGRPPRRQRWQIALGSAAGLVLVAGIAWHVGHDALQAPAPAALSRPELARPELARPEVVPVQPLEPGSTTRNARGEARSVPEAAAPPPPANAAARPAAKPNATMPEPAPAPATADTAEIERAPAPRREQRARDSATDHQPKTAERQTGAATAASPAAELPSAPAPSRDQSAVSSDERARDMPAENAGESTPAEWIAHIRTLIRQHRTDEAMMSLRKFRRAYPQAALPSDLRALDR